MDTSRMLPSGLAFVAVFLQCCQVFASPRFQREVSNVANTGYTTVTTNSGTLRGKRQDLGDGRYLDIFLGIPYAKSPTGPRRFARPEPAEPWTGTRDALVHGDKCIQRIIPTDPPLTNVPFGEDCLVLDIYTVGGSPDVVHPTMMFIHGGGYYGGSGALYNFTNLALMNVTVVSIGYRLDVFGFLSTLDDVIPGNFGLLDQALALDWIKSNIGNFGGDASDVTLFGGSAGASSASILSVSPLTRGKFQKAILQSGVIMCPWALYSYSTMYRNAEVQARQLGQLLNCSLPDSGQFSQQLLSCLRKVDAEVLVNASVALQENQYRGGMIWTPVVETTYGVVPEKPFKLLEKTDELVPIPTLYGYTKEDGSWLTPDPENDGISVAQFKQTLSLYLLVSYELSVQKGLLADLIQTYLPNPDTMTPVEVRTALLDAMTDGYMVAPTVQTARAFGKGKGSRVPSYMFEWAYRPSYDTSPAWHGATHAAEKGFVLGLPVGPDPFKYPEHTEEDAKVARYVLEMWANFAKTGNPTHEPVDGVIWPRFQSVERDNPVEKMMVINTTLTIENFDRSERVAVWLKHFKPSGPDSGSTLLHPSAIFVLLSIVLTNFCSIFL